MLRSTFLGENLTVNVFRHKNITRFNMFDQGGSYKLLSINEKESRRL